MADVLEVVMLICFGLSWPINIREAWRARTTKGMSVLFYLAILFGYLAGIASKALKLRSGIATPWYVWFFYILNACMVAAGILIYFRNKRLDAQK